MTVITGYTASWTDPRTGANYPAAWIENRQTIYTALQSCLVLADVYTTEQDYQLSKAPVAQSVLDAVSYNTAPQSDWMIYFDISVMGEAGHDIVTQSMSYLQSKIVPI